MKTLCQMSGAVLNPHFAPAGAHHLDEASIVGTIDMADVAIHALPMLQEMS